MMNDQEISQEMAKILFSSFSNHSHDVDLIYFLEEGCVTSSIVSTQKPKGFVFESSSDRKAFKSLVRSLQKYYIDNGFGFWDVMRYRLNFDTGALNMDFESSVELREGTLTFDEYCDQKQG